MLSVSSLGIVQFLIWEGNSRFYINLIFVCMEDTTSAIANKNQPARFGNLSNGYLVVDSALGDQFTFLYYPNFDVESEFPL